MISGAGLCWQHVGGVGSTTTTTACDDRIIGWLQCPAVDTVCQDPPARGHHTGLICRGSLPHLGAARERSEFSVNPPLEAPLLIFHHFSSPEVFSTSGYFRKTADV